MIIVTRFRGRFRERAPEWVLSIGLLWWGILTLAIPGLFNQEFFYPLSVFMAQPFWGIFSIAVGGTRLTALLVNGFWKSTAHLRAVTAIFSMSIWASLLLAAATTEGRALSVPTFMMLMALDILALWWAAGDAKLADVKAKNGRK